MKTKRSIVFVGIPIVENYTAEDVWVISEELNEDGNVDMVPEELIPYLNNSNTSFIKDYGFFKDAGFAYDWFIKNCESYDSHLNSLILSEEEQLEGFIEIADLVIERKMVSNSNDYAYFFMHNHDEELDDSIEIEKRYYSTLLIMKETIKNVLQMDRDKYYFGIMLQ